MMRRILMGIAILLLMLPAWAQDTGEKQKQQMVEKLGPGDVVKITVFGQPDMTTDARVSERGTVAVPLIGETKIGGLTAEQAGQHIAAALKKGEFLKAPQVTVALTALKSRQVSVLGLVARPGRYALEDVSPRLADVIAAAGGITAGGADSVTVIRNGEALRVDALSKDFELRAGDTVNVDRAPVFYIYGEVNHPGTFRADPNLTVMQAIALGGGLTPRGSERRLKLRRPGPDGKMVETDASLQDLVKPDDVIFVREALF
jgi:polysaccharide biosynthesis/export protein